MRREQLLAGVVRTLSHTSRDVGWDRLPGGKTIRDDLCISVIV